MGKMEGIAEKFSSLEAVRRISSFIDGDNSSLCIKGLFGSSKGIVLSSAVTLASSRHFGHKGRHGISVRRPLFLI